MYVPSININGTDVRFTFRPKTARILLPSDHGSSNRTIFTFAPITSKASIAFLQEGDDSHVYITSQQQGEMLSTKLERKRKKKVNNDEKSLREDCKQNYSYLSIRKHFKIKKNVHHKRTARGRCDRFVDSIQYSLFVEVISSNHISQDLFKAITIRI